MNASPGPKVVDASALAALLFGEPAADEVAGRLGQERLLAPTLLPYEISSVCLKKIELYPEQRESLLDALVLLGRLQLELLEIPEEEMIAIAEAKGVTVYDASYLWLARAVEGELVTLDERLGRQAGR